jgi:hypothetical protein
VLEKKIFSSQLGRCSAHSGLTGGTERATKGEFATVVAETTCCVLAFRATLAVIGDVEARPRAEKKPASRGDAESVKQDRYHFAFGSTLAKSSSH